MYHEKLGENEREVVILDDFHDLMSKLNVFRFDEDETYNPDMIEEMLLQMECLSEINVYKVIDFQRLMEGLAAFGYRDLEMPKSRKNFDFTLLDVKSIRILNRLTARIYLELSLFRESNNIDKLSKA